MKILCATILLLFSGSLAHAQWEIVSAEAEQMKKQTSSVSEDFWLRIKIRNTSGKTLYLQGLEGWYMIEAYIRSEGEVWERQNIGVDRELKMVPVPPGAEIESLRRESVEDIGKSMMLTFRMAHAENDTKGSRVLLGEFKIPDLPGSE